MTRIRIHKLQLIPKSQTIHTIVTQRARMWAWNVQTWWFDYLIDTINVCQFLFFFLMKYKSRGLNSISLKFDSQSVDISSREFSFIRKTNRKWQKDQKKIHKGLNNLFVNKSFSKIFHSSALRGFCPTGLLPAHPKIYPQPSLKKIAC